MVLELIRMVASARVIRNMQVRSKVIGRRQGVAETQELLTGRACALRSEDPRRALARLVFTA